MLTCKDYLLAMCLQKQILIYGIGNEVLMDDGIGPRLVKDLSKKFFFQNVHYETAFIGGLEIIEHIQGYDTPVFIDAIKTVGGYASDVYLLTLDNFVETEHLSNVHDVSFLTAIDLGKHMGLIIPDHIYIIAVEILECSTFGECFTTEIEKKYNQIFRKICAYLEKICKLDFVEVQK
jgi:hydrogenase maturation protease